MKSLGNVFVGGQFYRAPSSRPERYRLAQAAAVARQRAADDRHHLVVEDVAINADQCVVVDQLAIVVPEWARRMIPKRARAHLGRHMQAAALMLPR